VNWLAIDHLLRQALLEDLGAGDVSTAVLHNPEKPVSAIFSAKSAGLLCGIDVALRCYGLLDPRCQTSAESSDGRPFASGDVLARVSGPASAVLGAERVSLNLLQHLSGIASLAQRLAERAWASGIRIVETRKTLPGLRLLQKYAVQTGTGFTHRYDLSSAVLLKDNHFAVAGLDPGDLVRDALKRVPHTMKVAAEAGNPAMVRPIVEAGAHIILLDNFTPQQIREAVALARSIARPEAGRVIIEVSGGVNEENLDSYLIDGVDVISIGALTHSAKAADISLEALTS